MRPVVRWLPSIVAKLRTKHGLTPSEAEEVLLDDSLRTVISRNQPHRPCKFGWTTTGKYIIVLWDQIEDDPLTLLPVTAYPVPAPRS